MTDSECYRLAMLFCATVSQKHPNVHWSMNQRAFALAVDEARAKGNKLASTIPTYDGAIGRSCPDFDRMLTLALSSCLIQYLSPSYTHFLSALSLRSSRVILERISASPDEILDMEEIVTGHMSHWE